MDICICLFLSFNARKFQISFDANLNVIEKEQKYFSQATHDVVKMKQEEAIESVLPTGELDI